VEADDLDKFDFSTQKRIAFDRASRGGVLWTSPDSISAFPFEWTRRLDHYPTVTEDNNTQSLAWTKILDKTSFTNLQALHYLNAYNLSVNGRSWKTYQRPQDSSLPDSLDTFYFIDTGDYSRWADTYSDVWSLSGPTPRASTRPRARGRLAPRRAERPVRDHRVPVDFDPDSLGSSHDLWHVYPHQGDLYIQDQIEYEGSPPTPACASTTGSRRALEHCGGRHGEPQHHADHPRRLLSRHEVAVPALQGAPEPAHQVSHPITEKDNFFFQTTASSRSNPPYFYVYSKLTSVSSESFRFWATPT